MFFFVAPAKPKPMDSGVTTATSPSRRLARLRPPLLVYLAMAPAVALLGLAVSVFVLASALENDHRSIATILQSEEEILLVATNSRQAIETLNGRLHQALLQQSAGITTADQTQTVLVEILQQLDGAAADLRKLGDAVDAEQQRERITLIAARLATYRSAVNVIATMSEVDLRTATSFMQSFDRLFGEIDREIDLIVQDYQRSARDVGGQATARAAAARRLTLAVTAAVVIFAFCVALISGRFILRSIQRIARVTRILANGDDKVSLDGLSSVPELDEILSSLEVFRRNLAEMAFLREVEHQKELHRVARADAEHALKQLQMTQSSLVEAEKMAALGGMVAGVAHEINTPIGICVTAISGLEERLQTLGAAFSAGNMKRSDLEQFLAFGRDATSVTSKSLSRADGLIKSFKKIAVNQNANLRDQFDLGTYLAEIVISLGPQFRKSRHKLETDFASGIAMDSYSGSIWQVVSNLVNNCLIHAFPDEAAGVIALTARQVGDAAVITCEDNGVGMPEDVKKRVFEPFFTTKRALGGSGLGLSIVFNIVTQELGGKIWVMSEVGHGTHFHVTIPLQAPLASSEESEQ